ncbi:MAG: Txe/YoeB family addiction module toxin [Spirochaeta sp.]|nr:Txe/YoeB family addiction module toxin [Spirochaeta sp.]
MDHFQSTILELHLILRRVNELIKAILRDPFDGIGKPEPLRHQLQGHWSRRISDEHRLVYTVFDDTVTVISCRFHY